MVNDAVVALAMPLIAMLVVYLTLHERAVSASESAPNADVPAVPTDPGPRDWCRCGHTYEWHPSCARDVCGCQQFVFTRTDAA
ncbi:MAG: hypothetical protein AB7F65_07305 [Dehalococcoidia bacterium]